MDYKFFFGGIKNIILDPVRAWETIDSDNKPVKVFRNGLLFPLIILVSVSSIAGSLVFTNTELSPVYSILLGIKTFILLFFTVYIAAFILGEITFPLDLGKDFSVSFRLTVLSLVPFFLCQILSSFFESLLFVNITSLYGLYIFWTGADKLLAPPQYKKMPLLISSIITTAVIYVLINILLNVIIDKIYFAFFA